MTDRDFMALALREGALAAERGEIPVGCVIVRDGTVIASAGNGRERDRNAISHAEILAIDMACRALGGWRLVGCTLYVTLEPCPMCAGAIINARVPRVVFGAADPKAGAFGGLFDMNKEALNHHPQVEGGVMAEECADALRSFFRKRRSGEGFDASREWRRRRDAEAALDTEEKP